jgi:hypothetical protein
MRIVAAAVCIAMLLAAAACVENEPGNRIVGSWVIDVAAQREEIARISPDELEDFDEAFRTHLSLIRETFHRDGRYEVMSPLGGPFDDRWELVSEDETTVTVRSSGHSWVARRTAMGTKTHRRSDSLLGYTFSDPDHMAVKTRMPVFGEEKAVAYFFVRVE